MTSSNVKLDRFNVVEAVFLPPGALQHDQIFRIFVNSYGHTMNDDFSDQPFGLYAWNVKCDEANRGDWLL